MAVASKTLLTLLTFLSFLKIVCVLPIGDNLKRSRTTESAILSYDTNGGEILVRTKKELIIGPPCARGKQRYLKKCRFPKEIQQIKNDEYSNTGATAATKKAEAVKKGDVLHTTLNTSTTTVKDVLDTEQFEGTESTREEVLSDTIATEASPATVYDVLSAEERQTTHHTRTNDFPDTNAVKTITTTANDVLGAEEWQSTQRTRTDDFPNTNAAKTITTAYDVSGAEELQTTYRTRTNDFPDTNAVKTITTTVNDVSGAEELQSTQRTRTDDFPNTNAAKTITAEEVHTFESKSNIESMGSQVVSSTPTIGDKSDVNLDRMKNLMYTLLMVVSCAVVLTWLFKLLYDYYLRKDDNAASLSCST